VSALSEVLVVAFACEFLEGVDIDDLGGWDVDVAAAH